MCLRKKNIFKAGIWSVLIAFSLLSVIPCDALAQNLLANLPAPGVPVLLSQEYAPATLIGIKIYPDNPFQFDFILHSGDAELEKEQIKLESKKLIKYFLASLTIPEDELWVNLSPYEQDRIISENLGQT